MNIIELAALSNGAHRNQSGTSFLPNGWVELPPDYAQYLPFITITESADGTYCFADNPEARATQEAADAEHTADVPPTVEEQLRADVDFLAAMQGVTL